MLLSAPAPPTVSHDEWKTTTTAIEADTEDNLRELQQRIDGSQVGEPTYRMKIYMDFNLATWLRSVNFTELNISEFLFLNFYYMIYH